MSAPPEGEAGADHVLGADGRFQVADEAVRLSVYAWEDWITLAVFWILAVVVFYQVFTRYVLNDAAGWTEEIARYLLIAVTFLGGAMAVRRSTHIQVDFVYRFLPRASCRLASTRCASASSATRCGSPGCSSTASAPSAWRSSSCRSAWCSAPCSPASR